MLAGDAADHIAEAPEMVHLYGDLVQPAVPPQPAMLADGAPHLDPTVLRLTHIVRSGEHHGVSIVRLAREAEHQ